MNNSVENHISRLSTAFGQLTGGAGSLITKFKASASQPINDLIAAGYAAMRDAENAASSAQRDRDQLKSNADEIAAETERKGIKLKRKPLPPPRLRMRQILIGSCFRGFGGYC